GATALEGGDDATDDVLDMDHVKVALTVAIDLRFVFEVLLKKMTAIRSVDAGDAQDNSGKLLLTKSIDQRPFRLDEDFAGFAGGIRGGGFFYRRAIGLGVDTRAAGINELLRRSILQPFNKVLRAFQIDFAIFL